MKKAKKWPPLSLPYGRLSGGLNYSTCFVPTLLCVRPVAPFALANLQARQIFSAEFQLAEWADASGSRLNCLWAGLRVQLLAPFLVPYTIPHLNSKVNLI